METMVSRAAEPQGIWVFRFLALRPVVGPWLKARIHGRARMENRRVVQLGRRSPVLLGLKRMGATAAVERELQLTA